MSFSQNIKNSKISSLDFKIMNCIRFYICFQYIKNDNSERLENIQNYFESFYSLESIMYLQVDSKNFKKLFFGDNSELYDNQVRFIVNEKMTSKNFINEKLYDEKIKLLLE